MIQPDGKILVAGYVYNGSNYEFGLVRYNTDGSLDTTFDGDGRVNTAVGSNYTYGKSVTLQSDGKILVAGHTSSGGGDDFALVRYNADGSLDTTFSGDGKVTTSLGASSDTANSVTVQADGKILVAGSSVGATTDFGLVRYNANGSLDTTFDGDGMVTTGFGTSTDTAYSVTVQADGKILVAGISYNGAGDTDFALARYNTDGSLDTTFDGDGKVTTPIGAGHDRAYSVTVQADGKILVAGSSSNGSNNDVALVRYNTNGTLDTTFDGDGILTTDVSGGADTGNGVAVKSDGTILIAGTSGSNFALVGYNPDGSLDTNFNLINTLDGAPTFTEGGAAVILDADVQIFDVELSAANNFSGATLTLARNGGASAEDIYSATGTLSTLTQGGNLVVGGTTIGTVTTNSSGTLVLTFNASATNALVNSAMQQIAYANSSDAPLTSVQIDWTFDDGNTGSQGTGGALQAMGSTTVNINATNDAPVNYASGPKTVIEETATALAGISIDDPDAGASLITTRLVVSNGTLNVTLAGTATISVGANDSSDLTIEGTVAEINATLATLNYTGNTDVVGTAADTLSIITNDGGNTGSGGPNMTVNFVQIDITGINDEQSLDTNAGLTLYEGGTATITSSELATSDVDNTAGQLTYTIDAAPSNGTVFLSGVALNTSDTFTQADIDAGQITYTHDGGETTSDSFDFTVDDGVGTTTSSTFSIVVDAVNDAPNFSVVNSTPMFVENGGAVNLFSGTSIDLIEVGDAVSTLKVTVDAIADGNHERLIIDGEAIELTDLNAETTANNGYDVAVTISGSTATVTITKVGGYSAAAAESLVNGLAYDNTSENPQGSVRLVTLISIQDDGGTANGGADTAGIGLASLVSIQEVNDAPVLDNSGNMDLSDILQNTTNPNGDLVSAIIASAGGDRITDVDAGASEGLAITGVDDANGTWEYSIDGGASWSAFGSVSNDSAVLLGSTANDRIRFVPASDYSGNATIAFRAWDTSDAKVSGATGVDTGVGGGSTAFSTATETAQITVQAASIKLILSTTDDVGAAYSEPNSGVPGMPSWSEGTLISMQDTGSLQFGENTTKGTFNLVNDFDTFAADADVDITGLHYVVEDITVSGAGITSGSIDLRSGDVIFVTETGETLTTVATGAPAGWSNSMVTTGGGIYVFRADSLDDYSSGFFRQVMNDPGVQTQAITLAERATLIGDTWVAAGDFLFADSANAQRYQWYDTSLNASSKLVEGTDVFIADGISGLELVETGAAVGGVGLSTGSILVTLDGDDASVGSNCAGNDPQ